MNKKIFRSSLGVALLAAVSSIVLIMGILFGFFERQIQNELESEAGYIAYSLKSQGPSYLDNFSGSDKRITLIAPDGKVIADTSADAAALDNHADREEIASAVKSGSGRSVRYSDTLLEKTVYYAERLDDGNILRVSTTQYSAAAVLISLIQPLLIVLIIAALISLILSKRVSRAIINPINELDLNDPLSNDTYEELTPLLNKISAQKLTIDEQIEQARKHQEEFRLITENMSEGFLVIDSATNLLTYNRAALKLLEIDSVNDGSVLMLNRTKSFREVIKKALGGERAESGMELDERVYSLIANPVTGYGKIIGAVIIIIDVTERAKNEQLRREFTSNVSHELKTPLTSISGFAELLKEGGIPADTAADFAQSIYSETQRLITLVNDIIKISELDEKSVIYEKEPVDLRKLSEETADRLRREAEKKNVEITVSGDNAVILGVRKIIAEMIYNLCDNAVKYNRENGKAEIIITASETKTRLTVRDTGIGIPASCRSRVFERFYRADKSHSKEIGGTGLGLAIVKHGAIYHNAEIDLKSTEGKGTSITIVFPNI